MKTMQLKIRILLFLSAYPCTKGELIAQSSYSFSNYAASGDTLYLTKAQTGSFNFDTTGTNISWNYSALVGISQRELKFRPPSQTGFTNVQWPYLYNSSNVNLSSTDGNSIAVANLQYTDPNDYFLSNSQNLEQKALSYKIVINSNAITIKTVFNSPDVIYKFPLAYGTASDSSLAQYSTNIPGVYYKESVTKRKNTVTGWGSITTPYGTFNNCLKLVSEVMQVDSTSIDTISFPKVTTYYKEYKWLDPSQKYPLLVVRKNLTGNSYVTQSVEYLDNQLFFQPNALFAFLPLNPTEGDTVMFQNVSINATTYSWDFSDPQSASDTSTLSNPYHIFSNYGTYPVRLIAKNGNLADTSFTNVMVTQALLTSIVDRSLGDDLKIFPNPATDLLTVSSAGKIEEVQLFNPNGELIYSIKNPTLKSQSIDLNNLQAGFYFIKVKTDKNITLHKLIKND